MAPMGTPENPDSPDTGHGPNPPSAGTLLSPAEIAARRAQLQAELAQLASAENPPSETAPENPAPVPPAATVNMLETPTQPQSAAPEPSAKDEPAAEPAESAFSHWLHLADGRVIKALGTYTRHHDTDNPLDPGVPVVATVANPKFVEGHGDVDQRRRSLIAELKALGFDLSELIRPV